MSHRLRKIDELVLDDHYYLDENDSCYYLMEYTTGQSFEDNDVTDLILNLKKSPLRKNRPEYKWKHWAIGQVIRFYRAIFPRDFLEDNFTLVPIPPSKAKDHEEYDDRMLQILEGLCEGFEADIRELIVLNETRTASHLSLDRPTPEQLARQFTIDETFCASEPAKILVFDDMITTGAHFVACKTILQQRFPDAQVVGVFIARRMIEDED